MKKFLVLFTLLLALAFVLAACGGGEEATPEPTPAPTEQPAEQPTAAPAEQPTTAPAEQPAAGLTCDAPVKVGLITDQTGPLAIYGAHVLRAFPLGMEYATGNAGTEGDGYTSYMLDECEIQVYTRDDQSNPENTATVGRELIEVEGVDIIVGTVSSGATASLQELAVQNDVILIAAPAAANDLTGANFNDHTFRTSRNNYQDAVNICQYLTTEYTSFVQIAPDYSFGQGSAQAFRDACTLFGGEFVGDDIFAPADTTDFTAYMDPVFDAIDNGAEAFIVTWAGGGFVPLLQAATDLGVIDEIPMAAGFVDNVVMPAFFSNAIGSTSGILYHYTLADNEINDWLVAATTDRFGVPPDLFDADAMNAAILLTEALKATDGDASASAMIDAMEGMEFEGPKGAIYIRPEDHVAIQDMYVAKLLNVDDPEFKYFEYVATNRPNVPCLLPEGLQDRCGDLPIGALGSIEEAAAAPEPEAAALTCDEPIKVGVITDESGPLAIYGAHVLRAFPLGMEFMAGSAGTEGDGYTSYMVDDCEIQVYNRDDQSNPENTATVGRELIEVIGVDIIVGTVSSGATATLQELARENEVIHIAAPAAANDLTGATFNEYSFRTSRNNYQDAVNICQYLTTQYTSFVQIAPDYSFGQGSAQAFRDACTVYGGQFVGDDIFAPAGTTDFTAYMDPVFDAIDNGAEAFIVTWAGGGFVPLLQAATDLGVIDEIPMAAGFVDNVVMPAFFSNAIGSTSGILYHYTLADNEINDWLVAATTERFGVPPDLFDADAMNAAILVVNALRATGGDASAAALIGVMEGMEFEGPKGTIYIRPEDHVAIQDMYVAKLLNVDDPEFKYFEYVATNRPDVPCLLPEGLQDRCGDLPVGSLSGE